MFLRPRFLIDSKEKLAEAVEKFQILPFFSNEVTGLSIEEMCASGKLFGGNFDEGSWEWKGPVIRTGNSAYGKFFRRKAGFVSIDILPDFLNYRRATYPVKKGSTDEMLLEIIRENYSLTSTELKSLIFGNKKRTSWDQFPGIGDETSIITKRKSLESPLQRLQMGGWIIISDFEYKKTKTGERYGWGVARYSTPESVFRDTLNLSVKKSPMVSLHYIISSMKKNWTVMTRDKTWEKLLT